MDYTPVIRAQIETDVKRLRGEMSTRRLDGVRVGYLINSHRGMPVFKDGDAIDGLPVSIDRGNPRTVTVHGTIPSSIPLEDGDYDLPNREVTRSSIW